MAKFLVTNGSYYEPFTYDELSKPIMQAVEAHNAAQDTYDTIADQTELLRRYVEQEPENALVRQRYNEYAMKLAALQDNLWKNGFNAGTRRDLSAARAGYNSDITRIGNAIKARQERSAEFNKFRHEHPDAITSSDPGLASLDEYYKNDLYGQDYYNYSGNQFSAEVAADAKARASELLRNPEILKDPRLVGYLTRIEKEGFTNTEAQNAIMAVRSLVSMYQNDLTALNSVDENKVFAGMDEPSQILASVFLAHLKSTGAAEKVSNSEFDRLVKYGEFGISSAVGETKTQVLSDKVYDRQTQLMHARASRSGSGRDQDTPSVARRDRYTRTVEGVNYGETLRTYLKEFGEDGVIASGSGDHVGSRAEAASKVYSNNERIEFYEKAGFDLGRDIRHQKGEITTHGKTYETWYNKRTDQVLFREKGSGARPMASEALTNEYHRLRDAYEQHLEYYKKNAPEIYEEATKMDPEKQWKIYERDEIDFTTPITSYKDELFNKSGNEQSVYLSDTYLAQRGLDPADYIQRIGNMISSKFTRNDKGEVVDTDRYKSYNGKYRNIHEINRDGSLVKETIKNPSEIFTFDDKGNITNIDTVRLNVKGIRNGYFTFSLTNSNKEYAVGIDMFDSLDIEDEFTEALKNIMIVDKIKYPNEKLKNEDYDLIVNRCLAGVAQLLGFDELTLGRTGTGKPDEL